MRWHCIRNVKDSAVAASVVNSACENIASCISKTISWAPRRSRNSMHLEFEAWAAGKLTDAYLATILEKKQQQRKLPVQAS